MTTTNLQHLYDAIGGRTTKSEWVFGYNEDSLYDARGESVAQFDYEDDQKAASAMLTCADEILAVLRAAVLATTNDGLGTDSPYFNWPNDTPLKDALAALAAKSGQGGTK